MTDNLHNLTKKTYIATSMICICFMTGILVFLYFMMKQNEQANISALIADVQKKEISISKQIRGDFQTLNAIAVCIGDSDILEPEEYQQILRKINDDNLFIRMGSADLSGHAELFTIGGITPEIYDLSEYEFYERALRGQASISGTFPDPFSDQYINYYGIPVVRNGVITGVLCAVNSADMLYNIINVPVLNNEGYSCIIGSGGEIVNSSLKEHINIGSIMNMGTFDSETAATIESAMEKGERAVFQYLYENKKHMAILDPVDEVEGWFIFSSISLSVLHQMYEKTAFGIIILIAGACIFLALLLWWQKRVMDENQAFLEKLAYQDPVTGHGNYQKFIVDTKDWLSGGVESNYAVWYCDLKKFKYFNDIFGYSRGDKMLIWLSRLLEHYNKEGLFCRVAADNFAGIRKYSTSEELVDWFQELAKKISEEEQEFSGRIKIELCMGFFCPEKEDKELSINDMVNRANMAQKSVKSQPGSRYAFFTPEIRKQNLLEAEMETRGEKAIENGEFSVYFQPKINIQNSNKLSGAEVLARWIYPDKGIISPGVFIPFFEKSGMIVQLDRHMFCHACQWLSDYLASGKPAINLAINVSRLGLLQADFIDYYSAVKEKYGIPDRILELEFTESVILDDDGMFYNTVCRLQEKGFICSMDDFGAGYSSLNILKNLPINVLKMDILFFRKSVDIRRERIVIANIINMARELNMKTIAEGVETAEQVEFLRASGCNIVQGYIFAKPMPMEKFNQLLEDMQNLSFEPMECDC